MALKVNEIESDVENKEPNQQEVLKGLQDKIQKRYWDSSKTYVHDTDHNHDHLIDKEKPIEFTYICQIPFPPKVPQKTSTHTILKNLPEIPKSQEKALENQVKAMVANYRNKELSETNHPTEYSYEKDSESLSRPLKKRRFKC